MLEHGLGANLAAWLALPEMGDSLLINRKDAVA